MIFINIVEFIRDLDLGKRESLANHFLFINIFLLGKFVITNADARFVLHRRQPYMRLNVDGCPRNHPWCRKQEILNSETEQKRRERTEPPLSRNSRSVKQDRERWPTTDQQLPPLGEEGCKWGALYLLVHPYIHRPTASLLNNPSQTNLSL